LAVILIRRFAFYFVAFVGPGAEVDQFATFAAKGPVRIVFTPGAWRLALRTGDF